eukprot:12591969-Alexandrium_andersonii.AAC.1
MSWRASVPAPHINPEDLSAALAGAVLLHIMEDPTVRACAAHLCDSALWRRRGPVSYTHLTLPTICSV